VKRFAAAMLVFSTCLATAIHAQTASSYPPIAIPLKIDQVPGRPIYYSTGNPGVPGNDNEGNTSNAGFVVTSDGVVVFDALGTPSLGWALLQQIRKVTDKKIRYVIASHYHADHVYGLQAFKDHTDAVIVAQQRAGEYKENEETADEKAPRPAPRRAVSVGGPKHPGGVAGHHLQGPHHDRARPQAIDAAVCRAGAFFQRLDDAGRTRRRAVRWRYRAKQPYSPYEQR
jgi:hypothetical protein